MSHDKTRRNVLRGAGAVGLGAAAVGGLASTADAATPAAADAPVSPWPAASGRRVATVTEVRGDVVLTEGDDTRYRLEGFPEGWQIAAGDRVAIAPSVSTAGLVARPLITWLPVMAAPADLRPGSRLGSAAGPRMTEGATVPDALRTGDTTPRALLVGVEDRAAGAPRVIFVREP